MCMVGPTVFVVDDDVSVRESMKMLLEAAGLQVETFESGRHFLSRPPAPVPCCLVLDLLLPDLDGLAVQKLLADRTDMPIIFLTGHRDVATTVRAMKAGAAEFLTKPPPGDLLLAAIRGALDRSRTLREDGAQQRRLRGRYETLTPREREVMQRVVSGLLNKQVGADLGISEITVKAHRGRVMRKMNAGSLPELVMMAAQLDLLPKAVERIGRYSRYHGPIDSAAALAV